MCGAEMSELRKAVKGLLEAAKGAAESLDNCLNVERYIYDNTEEISSTTCWLLDEIANAKEALEKEALEKEAH